MTVPGVIELHLLGRFVVVRDGLEIPAGTFGGRKVRTLLRILATRRGSFVSHDSLAEMLWGDRQPADPAANLQVLVNRARRAVGRGQLLITGPGGYCLAAGDACVVDAEQFLATVAGAVRLEGRAALNGCVQAMGLWGGDPLSEDIFADWSADYRDRLLRARQTCLEDGSRRALELGALALAVEYAAAAANSEPLRESAVLLLVQGLAAAGDRAAALDRYDRYRRALADELGIDPSALAVAVQADLLRGRTVPVRSPVDAGRVAEFPELPFVGRDHVLEVLLAVVARRGRALLSGPSGSGKSRVLQVLSRRTPLIAIRAFAAERDEPWSLARSLLREVLDIDIRAAAEFPVSIRAALEWLLPELASAGSRPVPDPESRRALLVQAATRLLEGIGRTVVVDDLQWADATSLGVVEAALARSDGVAVVLAYRPDELAHRPHLGEVVSRLRADATVIRLDPLVLGDLGELIADDELVAAVAAGTDRTPMAVTEVLRALAAGGAIERTTQRRWRSTGPLTAGQARDIAGQGQRTAIAGRADSQPDRALEIIRILALVGREAPARLLAQATGDDERTVLQTLGSLARDGLTRLGDQGWATLHDLVSEVVAEHLVPGERGRLHALIAAALERTDTDPRDVARHWLGAGDPARAAQAYLRSAEQALAAFADTETCALADAGIAVAPTPDLTAALREVRAQARARLGQIPGARADLRAALPAYPNGPVRARLLGRLATLASGAQDLVRAAELAELAIIEAGSEPHARAQALEIAAVLDMNLDRAHRASLRAGEALELYQQLGDAGGAARILDGRAMATFLDGQVGSGIELLQRAADLFEDSGDLIHVITPRSTAGHGHVFAGRAELGLTHTTRALDLARTLGHHEGQTYALWHTTEALAALGRTDQALEAGQEALAIAVDLGHRGWTATAWRAIGIAQQSDLDLDLALESFERSLAASEHLNLFASWAAARCALVLIARGKLSAARPMVERALAEGPPLGHYEARVAQVELAAAQHDPAAATLARKAIRLAGAGGVAQLLDRLIALAAG